MSLNSLSTDPDAVSAAPAAHAPLEPPTPEPGEAVEAKPAAAFRVGTFEVGAGSCTELCGHPGIIY